MGTENEQRQICHNNEGKAERLSVETLALAGTGQRTHSESPVQMLLW